MNALHIRRARAVRARAAEGHNRNVNPAPYPLPAINDTWSDLPVLEIRLPGLVQVRRGRCRGIVRAGAGGTWGWFRPASHPEWTLLPRLTARRVVCGGGNGASSAVPSQGAPAHSCRWRWVGWLGDCGARDGAGTSGASGTARPPALRQAYGGGALSRGCAVDDPELVPLADLTCRCTQLRKGRSMAVLPREEIHHCG